jgi:hypothetical protein
LQTIDTNTVTLLDTAKKVKILECIKTGKFNFKPGSKNGSSSIIKKKMAPFNEEISRRNA